MLGVNAFYDHEFPYDHGRYSIGLEARSTIGEINANMYQATDEVEDSAESGFEEQSFRWMGYRSRFTASLYELGHSICKTLPRWDGS